ncbi:hypothetical protein AJ80_09986 [Polytolypa hystricis UAMH7299]|uniref:W2 domain-containing protein n=1 Tax=Polytolypa hystricis (strain UAMH7299) TaxID=1447883 RepID=A0A2B7WFQ6_POLH7|nr:hypothetical protein AJ80_09986 [Polytolypa hystricis UAMH7299]
MSFVNVRRGDKDPFYRYKMERLQAKIEGKGNGIKTVIVNLNNVAQALARPPSYLIKYFGFELGAQANAKPMDDRWIINGAHDANKLQDYLDGFIKKFVLCDNGGRDHGGCGNPETEVVIKDERIILDCKACGHRTNVDPRLKLSSFILKNQPKKGKKDKSTKKSRRERNKEKAENGETNGSPGESNSDVGADENGDVGDDDDAHSDDELTRRIKAEANQIEHDDAEDIKWAVDLSAEAIAARAKELPSDLKRSLAFDDADEEEGENGSNAYDQLGSWIMAQAEESETGVSGVSDVEVYLKAKELGIETKHKTLAVLAQTLFDDKIVKQIPARAGMLQKMLTSERHHKAFLGGTERFVGNDRPELIATIPAILLAYYQEDLVPEEVLKAWGKKASKKYVDLATSKKVRKAAEKFLEWLETAESEDDDDSEEE